MLWILGNLYLFLFHHAVEFVNSHSMFRFLVVNPGRKEEEQRITGSTNDVPGSNHVVPATKLRNLVSTLWNWIGQWFCMWPLWTINSDRIDGIVTFHLRVVQVLLVRQRSALARLVSSCWKTINHSNFDLGKRKNNFFTKQAVINVTRSFLVKVEQKTANDNGTGREEYAG